MLGGDCDCNSNRFMSFQSVMIPTKFVDSDFTYRYSVGIGRFMFLFLVRFSIFALGKVRFIHDTFHKHAPTHTSFLLIDSNSGVVVRISLKILFWNQNDPKCDFKLGQVKKIIATLPKIVLQVMYHGSDGTTVNRFHFPSWYKTQQHIKIDFYV